jgi:serine/threonine protein kinase
VYLGTDTRLDRKVAIKVLTPGSGDDQDAHDRLLREARIVARIDHPNVCTIYEVGQDLGRSYMVMQYVEGVTLLERMRSGPISPDETRDIACQITAALLSPEQLRDEPLDGRSDLFSLGVLLYEVVAGARPFDRMTAAATITAILTDDPAPIDGPLAPVISRALENLPSRRYSSAAAMREALLAVRKR